MSVYPSVEEVFGPGRSVRLDPYDAIRDARSEARYEPGHAEPQQWEVDEAAQVPLEAPESPPEGLIPRG